MCGGLDFHFWEFVPAAGVVGIECVVRGFGDGFFEVAEKI